MVNNAPEKRAPVQLLATPRSAPRSLLRTQLEQIEPPPTNPAQYLRRAFWPWITNYLRVATKPRYPFRAYDLTRANPGMYRIPNQCRIALASDWGTGTASAYRVRDRIRAEDPDVTIHLGDVYYSGTTREFEDYFLGADDWPRGTLMYQGPGSARGSYALNANHEMYSGGEGYFGLALERLGQEASYFGLANDYWLLVALDTGYYAKILPLLELLPWWIKLHRANLRWFREVVLGDATTRPIILLSHHQLFSAFEYEYTRIGRQLGQADDRVLLWFWGHEHRLAGYGAFGFAGGPRVHARCIGHGGMPIEIGPEPKPGRNRNLVFYDRRTAYQIGDQAIGYCGYASLTFTDRELRIAYRDEGGKTLLEERWVSDNQEARGEVLGHAAELEIVTPIDRLVR